MTRGGPVMASAVDLSGLASLERFLDVLVLALLGAMVYFGMCRLRRRKDAWGLVFTWSALGSLIMHGGLCLGRGAQAGRPAMTEVPGAEPTVETLSLLHALGELLGGAGILLAGIALMYLGWHAGRAGSPRPRHVTPKK